ncbi:MAG: MFS transporter [Acetobacteraceae bacterium]
MQAPTLRAATPSRPRVISILGIGQILAWGSSYYLPAVLATAVTADTGWPAGWVLGALSIGLLISGLVSPRVGHLIERHGGRPVLAVSVLLLAAGLVIQALAPHVAVFVLAWVVIGVGMGAGLYDPAFSTLTRLYGEAARSAITSLTLWGGFASTVCWPFTAFLVAHVGWRGASLAYAAIHLLIVLPMYWFGLPREAAAPPPAAAKPGATNAERPSAIRQYRGFLLILAVSFTVASIIMTVIAVHLIAILQDRGFSLATAVWLGMLIGPSQVGARLLEAMFGRRAHPIWSLVACTAAVVVGLATLMGRVEFVAIGLVLYGGGNGLRSIARGTVPLAMFGREGYAVLMGWLAMPVLVAQAISPSIGELMIGHLGTDLTIACLTGLAALNLVATLWLVPAALRRGVATG